MNNLKRLGNRIMRAARALKYLHDLYGRVYKQTVRLKFRTKTQIMKIDLRKPSHLMVAFLILFSLLIPLLERLVEYNGYELSQPTRSLLTPTNSALTSKIK